MDTKNQDNKQFFLDYFKPQTQEDHHKEMSKYYGSAKKRLEQCNKDRGQTSLLDHILTSAYGATQDEVDQLTEFGKEERARRHIYQDLLLTTLHQPNGEPSEFNLRMARAFNVDRIDPDDYEPLPKNWVASKNILNELAPISYSNSDKDIAGAINTLGKNDKATKSEDVVERYAIKFTQEGQSPQAIAIPFTVDFGHTVRIDNNAGDFVEPLGGPSCSRIVFLKKSL